MISNVISLRLALRLSGPSDLQTKCLIFGFCCGLPLAQVKIITATVNGHTTTNDNNNLRRPSHLFCLRLFSVTPPSPFRLIMVGRKGWFIQTFGRTIIKLVNLLWWIIIGTTAAPWTETPPSLVGAFVSGKCCLSDVPFSSPAHLTEKTVFYAVTEGGR